jgi:hypothetical protein
MSRGTWIVAASGRARSWSRVKMRVWSPTVTVIVGSCQSKSGPQRYTQSADVPNYQIVATCFSIKRTGK